MFSVCSLMLSMADQYENWPYRVEMWDDQDTCVEQVIALLRDHAVALAAFAEAAKRRPGKIVILRQKARVLADSRSVPGS